MWGSVGSSSVVVGEVPVEVVDLLLAVLQLHGGVGTPSPLLLQGAKHLAMETEGAIEELVTSATIPMVVLKATGALEETQASPSKTNIKEIKEEIVNCLETVDVPNWNPISMTESVRKESNCKVIGILPLKEVSPDIIMPIKETHKREESETNWQDNEAEIKIKKEGNFDIGDNLDVFNKKRWCDVCQALIKGGNLSRHKYEAHKVAIMPYHSTFHSTSPQYLTKAPQVGEGPGFACIFCSKKFPRLESMKKHGKACRMNPDMFPCLCPRCGKRFRSSDAVYNHMKNGTCEQRPVTCNICSEKISARLMSFHQNDCLETAVHTGN